MLTIELRKWKLYLETLRSDNNTTEVTFTTQLNYLIDRFPILILHFQLSDVEAGGYTVFTELDIYLKPVKGAMVMWYNLYKSLDGDSRTLHAGCPVLKGSKRSK